MLVLTGKRPENGDGKEQEEEGVVSYGRVGGTDPFRKESRSGANQGGVTLERSG